MAIHDNVWTLAIEGIDEFLVASKMSLDHKKADGGCLGYPATLLLLCAVNALGTYLIGDSIVIDGKPQKITRGEPFRVLNHAVVGLALTGKEIKLIEDSYRNRLAHNAIIETGSFLLPSDDEPSFIFESGLVGIRVFSFYRLVLQAWQRFPKDRIQAWEQQRQKSKSTTR
jgi:hypothetical protein